ncbi:MAG: M15 family metallopeptidase [Reichenbachiella sp.]|uniref:M15 family metallopeptidase n=1 Tax=Reichenbachiella sp. TaxID=2184521 RepID=UPI003265BB29
MKKRIKLIQKILKNQGNYNGAIDGIIGPNTIAALSTISAIHPSWSRQRKIVAAIQVFANKKNIPCKPIDGFWGPITQVAFEALYAQEFMNPQRPFFRPEEIIDVNPNNWPKQYTPSFNTFFGDQGAGLVSVNLPYRHKLSWRLTKSVGRIKCHEKVAESLTRVLDEVLRTYGQQKISDLRLDVWGGCFNIRPIRGGRKPSMHSWGIAMDYDPNRNRLRWSSEKAEFAKPEYKDWWSIWESEGWVSLGRSRNFDWMHVQAAKI